MRSFRISCLLVGALVTLPYAVHAEPQEQPYTLDDPPERFLGTRLVFTPTTTADTIDIAFSDDLYGANVARSACLVSKIMDEDFCSKEEYRLELGCGPGTLTPPHEIDDTWELHVGIHQAGADLLAVCGATSGVATVGFS